MFFVGADATAVAAPSAACFKILFVWVIGSLHIDAATIRQIKAITIIVMFVVVAVAIRIVDAAAAAAASASPFAPVTARALMYLKSHVIAICI